MTADASDAGAEGSPAGGGRSRLSPAPGAQAASLSRRRFLAGVPAGVALPAVALAASGATAASPGEPGSWVAGLPGAALPQRLDPVSVRGLFEFSERHVPMNAANLCPTSRPAAQALAAADAAIDLDCSFQNRAPFGTLLEHCRARIAAQLSVSPDEVALVRNTSEANNIVNAGLALEPGDEVVLWDQNHPTNNVAWAVRAARYGIVVRTVTLPAQPRDAGELIEPFVRAFTPKTRVLAVSHVSNVSGLALPVRELCDLAHARGIHVHVDGAQSWGVLHVDLPELGCDSYAASAHKWYMGPREVGLLYVRSDAIGRIWPAVVAPGWGDDVDPDPVGARKFESLGQRDDAALTGLGVAAGLHDALADADVRSGERYTRALAQHLKNGLVEAGATLVTPMAERFSAGVCVVSVPSANRAELFRRLYAEHGIAAAPTGGLRLCPHVYNTSEHVDRVLAGMVALRSLLA
ncbi:MAG: aminotransferase class V-fold PLP-dependent enzyme [Pseudomonadales bacterium]